MKAKSSRRKFIAQLGGSSLLLAADSIQSVASNKHEENVIFNYPKFSPNDKIRIATIGMRIIGSSGH
jgi:hypothetical protein